MAELIISHEDIDLAEQLRRAETTDPLTLEEVYKKGVFCILVGAEKYPRAVRLYQRMVASGLNDPDHVLSRLELLETILQGSNWSKRKWERIVGFSCWWLEDEGKLMREILDDAQNGREKGFELRQKLTKADGIGLKSASFLMNSLGYEELVALDRWMLQFLADQGYGVRVPDYERIGALNSLPEYIKTEQIVREIAAQARSAQPEYILTPAGFQRIIWCRATGWGGIDGVYHLKVI